MVATLNNGGSYQDLLALAQGQQLSEEQSRLIIRSALADTFDWFQVASAAEDPGLRAIALDIMAPYTEILETYQDTITGEVWNR
jgi:predicted xylose isomerase-like sugar epimerase